MKNVIVVLIKNIKNVVYKKKPCEVVCVLEKQMTTDTGLILIRIDLSKVILLF